MFGPRQFSWSGQNLLEEITDTTENLMKWNILLVKGKKKKINRDFESSGERNWKLSLVQEACIFFYLYNLNLCGTHKTKEGKSPVVEQIGEIF